MPAPDGSGPARARGRPARERSPATSPAGSTERCSRQKPPRKSGATARWRCDRQRTRYAYPLLVPVLRRKLGELELLSVTLGCEPSDPRRATALYPSRPALCGLLRMTVIARAAALQTDGTAAATTASIPEWWRRLPTDWRRPVACAQTHRSRRR